MTSARHASGTDRLAEVAARRRYAAEPHRRQRAGRRAADRSRADPAGRREPGAPPRRAHGDRLRTRCATPRELVNPNVVKVVLDDDGLCALFQPRARSRTRATPSRAASARIPRGLPVYRHLGIYAYRAGFLRRFTRLAPAAHRALRGAGAAARARARLSHRRRGHAPRAASGRGYAGGPAARAPLRQVIFEPRYDDQLGASTVLQSQRAGAAQ